MGRTIPMALMVATTLFSAPKSQADEITDRVAALARAWAAIPHL